MQRFAINRMELELFYDCLRLGVAYSEVNDQSVRSVNQFANVCCCNGESAVQTATIDVARNQFLCAKSLSGFLSVLATRSTYKCKFFHCLNVVCVT